MKAFSYLKNYKKQLILGPMFKLLEAIFELIIPFIVAMIIDKGIVNNDWSYVLKYGFLIIGLGVLGLMSTMVCQYFASVASQGFGTELRNAIYEKMLRICRIDFETYGKGNIQTIITNDVNQLQVVVAMIIRLVIRAPFLVIGALVCSFLINWKIGFIFLGVTLLIAAILGLFIYYSSRKYLKVQSQLDVISTVTGDSLEGTRVIRAFNKEDETIKSYEDETKEYKRRVVGIDAINALLNPLTFVVINIGIVLVLYFGGFQVESGFMSTGDIVALINYLNQILIALVVVSNLVVIFTKGYACKKRVDKFLALNDFENNGTIKAEDLSNDTILEFNNVSFGFSKEEPQTYVLEDINLNIKEGETVGIIGGTASGKSTILNLIERFFDPQIGEIKFKGKNIKEIEIDSYRDKIALVTQKASVIKDTIKGNLVLGNKNITDDEINHRLYQSTALGFVNEKQDKIYELIQEGGKNFSGGQKQRLSLTRALLKDSEILILDDSYSALDFITEKVIKKNIKEIQKSKKLTTIVVSQRTSSLRDCDQIIVLDHGKIVGNGTHKELLKNCELYKEINNSQSKGGR